MSAIFEPSRLQIARARCEFFQNDLAQKCEVAPHTIAAWESGAQTPSDDNVARLVAATGFGRNFFFAGPIEPLMEGAASFRGRSRIPARQKHSALAAGAMARELATWIEQRFELPVVDVPDLSAPEVREDPELLARVVRDSWMLGIKPIPNMIHLLESRGVLVFSLARNVQELDAFSFWANGRPIVLLNTMKSAERSRMDAAHELLHLVCRHESGDKAEERVANEFAGAFLMPGVDLHKNVPRVPSLVDYSRLKHRWGVSLSALVYRLHELKLLSDWTHRTMFIELSKRGCLKKEPNPMPAREGSAVLSKVFDALAERDVRPSEIARELGWNRRHLDELIFGLGATMVPVEGGGKQPRDAGKRGGHLQLVNPRH